MWYNYGTNSHGDLGGIVGATSAAKEKKKISILNLPTFCHHKFNNGFEAAPLTVWSTLETWHSTVILTIGNIDSWINTSPEIGLQKKFISTMNPMLNYS